MKRKLSETKIIMILRKYINAKFCGDVFVFKNSFKEIFLKFFL